jgi:hypothetical protein
MLNIPRLPPPQGLHSALDTAEAFDAHQAKQPPIAPLNEPPEAT